MCNNLITIYGKAGSGKSTIAKLFLKEHFVRYLDFEKDFFELDYIIKCIEKNNIVIIDYIELAGLTFEDILKLKDIIKDTDKKVIIVSCCSVVKVLFNEKYNKLKEISDIFLLIDK